MKILQPGRRGGRLLIRDAQTRAALEVGAHVVEGQADGFYGVRIGVDDQLIREPLEDRLRDPSARAEGGR